MNKKYPLTIYAYAILLDNKIENWSVSFNIWFKTWKHADDYRLAKAY